MVKEIPLQNGMVALVDDEDFERVNQYTWHASGFTETNFKVETQIRVGTKRKTVTLQRFILMVSDSNVVVLFEDSNPLNCQKDNLLLSDKRKRRLKSKGHKNSTSKYKGVSWFKNNKKWVAKIRVNGKDKHLGYFHNEDDAALAYNEAAKEIYGEGCYLNELGTNNNAVKIEIQKSNKVNRNMKRVQKSSEYRGVHLDKRRSKWVASIIKEKKPFYLGQFSSEREAAKIYDQKAYELYGDRAILNFPELIEEYKRALQGGATR